MNEVLQIVNALALPAAVVGAAMILARAIGRGAAAPGVYEQAVKGGRKRQEVKQPPAWASPQTPVGMAVVPENVSHNIKATAEHAEASSGADVLRDLRRGKD